MSKARILADFISTGEGVGILADGAISYAEVTGKPTLAAVATSGAYADVTGTPTLPTDFVSAANGGTFGGNIVAPRLVDSGNSSYHVDPFGTSVMAYAYLQQSYALNLVLSGTTPTVTAGTHSSASLTTSGNTTFTFSVTGASTGYLIGFVLRLTSGGSHTIAWPSSVDWAGGSAPDVPASGETNILVFITHDAGTNWYGFQSGAAMA